MLEPRTVQLLHVEDDDLCIMGLERAFKSAKIANPISFAHDGIEWRFTMMSSIVVVGALATASCDRAR